MGTDLCIACRTSLPRVTSACARCAAPLKGDLLDALCGRCQIKPPDFERTLAVFVYEQPMDYLLQRLKFDGRLEMARVLGELMAVELESIIEDWPDALIPVPLHDERLRERGFNQSLELGRFIAKRLQLPLHPQVCRRLRSTESQSGLSRKARMKNVKGAFSVRGELKGHLAIIDDVLTTGSTAHEMARSLLQAGAERVDVWVCARA